MKKKFFTIFLIFSLVALCGNLTAKENKQFELCLGGGSFFFEEEGYQFGMISVGVNYKVVGWDLSGLIRAGAIIAGNLKLGLLDAQTLIPYATGGVWTTSGGGFGFNIGGGLKLKLTEMFAIRAEYRYWFVGEIEWGVNSILGGISIHF